MAEPRLSVVIPAYNEAAVIRRTLMEIQTFLAAAAIDHEIVVVDDGSTDDTVAIVRGLVATTPSIRLLQSGHRGKGAAVKQGMLAVRGTYRLFLDADHSTRIQEWRKCAPWLEDGFEVVIGSRKMAGAVISVRQSRLRESMGKTFTWLTNALLPVRVSDITCGFKCFQAQAARDIFTLQRLEGWGFDAEILFIARRRGYRLKEVPVVWADDASTKVKLLRDAWRSFTELLQIRLGSWRGWYPSSVGAR
jgi:dolichyl-phosphate beta-glucosyltransferase